MPNPPNLLLLADPPTQATLSKDFVNAGVVVILPPGLTAVPVGLTVDAALQVMDIPVPLDNLPWFVWMQSNDPARMLTAYQAGARAVFPRETPPQVVVQAILRSLSELRQPNTAPRETIQRRYQRRDFILLEADTVLQVQSGVLATTMIHQDGAEVLLGLSGPGQILIAHPADNCHIQIVAHTDALVSIQDWETARHQPDFPEKLRVRLQHMEGWAAMQARPYLDQRILGILGLLASQFGRPCDQGVVIDVRVTHAQLASAVGATRTSITRVLGELRTMNKLLTVGEAGNERFCLREAAPQVHC